MARGLAAIVLVSLAAQAQPPGDKPASGPCPSREGPDAARLQQVCEHVVANRLPVMSHPATWSILRQEDAVVEGRPIVIAYLSCCYMGDRAHFDRGTGKLVRYLPGPQ